MLEPTFAAAPVPTLMSLLLSSLAAEGTGKSTVIVGPNPLTVTSVAFRFVVFSSVAEADEDAEAEELLPFDVPDVDEQAASANTITGTEVKAAIRAKFEVTDAAYPALLRESGSYMPAMSLSTRSSTLRNGSLQSTVLAAWSFSLRWTQSTVKSRRCSCARLMNSPRSLARVV